MLGRKDIKMYHLILDFHYTKIKKIVFIFIVCISLNVAYEFQKIMVYFIMLEDFFSYSMLYVIILQTNKLHLIINKDLFYIPSHIS